MSFVSRLRHLKSRFWLYAGAIWLLSCVLHAPFLWYPAQVIFDEYHFGKFINAYCCSKAMIFDIHPPHPKLIMSWLVRLAGYSGDQGFATIGEAYLPGTPVWALRLWPIILGTCIPVIGFSLLWRWGAGSAWALTGGIALALENSLLLETGIIALDGQLIFGSMAALLTCELFLSETRKVMGGFYGIMTGIFLALAVSAKFTGLAAIGVVGVRVAGDVISGTDRTKKFVALLSPAILAVMGFCAWYIPGWILHFKLLDQPGPGTAFYAATGSFPVDFVNIHKIMLNANNGIKATHPWQSEWWQWPLMRKAIYYWNSGDLKIFLVGNPWVWWGAQLVVLTLYWRRRNTIADVLLIAWLGSFVPYSFVSRGLFLYHYQPPLIWIVLLAILLLSRGKSEQPLKPVHIISLTSAGFLTVMPVTYGLSWWSQLPIWLLDLR